MKNVNTINGERFETNCQVCEIVVKHNNTNNE